MWSCLSLIICLLIDQFCYITKVINHMTVFRCQLICLCKYLCVYEGKCYCDDANWWKQKEANKDEHFEILIL